MCTAHSSAAPCTVSAICIGRCFDKRNSCAIVSWLNLDARAGKAHPPTFATAGIPVDHARESGTIGANAGVFTISVHGDVTGKVGVAGCLTMYQTGRP